MHSEGLTGGTVSNKADAVSLFWEGTLWTNSALHVSFQSFQRLTHTRQMHRNVFMQRVERWTEVCERWYWFLFLSDMYCGVASFIRLHCLGLSTLYISIRGVKKKERKEKKKTLCIAHSDYLLSKKNMHWTKRQRLKRHRGPSRSFVAAPSPLIEKQWEAWVIYTQDTSVPPGINSLYTVTSLDVFCIPYVRTVRGCEYFW